jgi:co-chaperonin GroES (HSP10)
VDIGKGTWAKDTGKWMPTKVKKDSDVYLFDNVAMPITVGEDEMLVCGENEILGEA